MKKTIKALLKCISVGTSVGTVVCIALKVITGNDAIELLGIGLVALSISSLIETD